MLKRYLILARISTPLATRNGGTTYSVRYERWPLWVSGDLAKAHQMALRYARTEWPNEIARIETVTARPEK